MQKKLARLGALLLVIIVIGAAIFVGTKFFLKDSPEKVVEEMLEAFLDQDYDGFESYVDYKEVDDDEDYPEEFDEVLDYISEEVFEYEDIEEISNNGKKAKVAVKVTTLDFLDLFEKLEEELLVNEEIYYYSEEEFDTFMSEFMAETVVEGDVDTVTKKVTLTLTKKKDEGWIVKDDDALMELIIGNYKKADAMWE